ncbi:MAG: GrpB family protein [Candidatus Kerfeldbacteria bacterium]|nr:GrpB family protein [Candidatus Kerfeldbacteria bacterium]
METAKEILQEIRLCSQKGATKLVAIDGFGGSGKSTFAKQLAELDSSIQIAELDKFPYLPEEYPYHPAGAQTRVNLERFEQEVLIPLTQGKEVRFQNTFWWKTDEQPQWFRIQPGGTVLVEGCYSFHKDIRHYYDYSIWIECAPEEAMERAVTRDGDNSRTLWEQVHAPNERKYVNVQHPQDYVDMVVVNTLKEGFVITTHNRMNIVSYNPEWPKIFQSEKEHVLRKLQDSLVEIHHIGSTAIPGLCAKPIIDIAMLIPSLKDAEKYIQPLAELGYEYQPERSSVERYFFVKGNPVKFHLSLAQPDTFSYWKRQVLFLDYLQRHPDTLKEYEELKKDLIKKFPDAGKEYSEGKSEFIQRILMLAEKEQK